MGYGLEATQAGWIRLTVRQRGQKRNVCALHRRTRNRVLVLERFG